MLDERFESDELDRSVWVPWYLPHWNSREASAATYETGSGQLRLSIPAGQPLWAEGAHLVEGPVPEPELVVSHVRGRPAQ